jgi:hypothetical protein
MPGGKLPAARPGAGSLPPLYLPRDIAEALHCSEWWVKEQARRGRIPFSKPGGRYQFTSEHFAEILRIFESRPASSGSTVAAAAAPVRRRQAVPVAASVARLKARTPRRAQRSQSRPGAA